MNTGVKTTVKKTYEKTYKKARRLSCRRALIIMFAVAASSVFAAGAVSAGWKAQENAQAPGPQEAEVPVAGVTTTGPKEAEMPDAEVPDTDAQAIGHQQEAEVPEADASETKTIDYMVLVNKLNPLPAWWEDVVETVHFTNTEGDDVEVEEKSYEAYLQLKEELEQEGIFVDLDSAGRSIAEQQRIMDEFTQQYGADYAAKIVAVPGYSEHHTGLALDLYLIIDGVDIVENEDMIRYPEIWAKIHEKLAKHGFILRYLEGKEHLTGYAYEPWHIRYIDDPDIAAKIMDSGVTFEEYLGVVKSADVEIDLGSSELYTAEELEEAIIQVKCRFATFEGCELHSIRYAGDACNSEDNIRWLNEFDGEDYVQVCEFLMDFHSPEKAFGAWEPDTEYRDYQWWLARTAEGGWQLLSWGY